MSSNINQELSDIFKEMSNIYKYMGTEERFRSLSYNKAAKVILSLQESVIEYYKKNALEEIPGIGKSIAEKIKEYINTGIIKKYNYLKNKVPHELIDMMEIKGFGPKSLKEIHEKLNISTKEQLINALQKNTIVQLRGFGKKKTDAMLRSLKLHKIIEERMLLWDALQIGKKITDWLKIIPEVTQIEIAGSLRRKKETIGDIDVLVSCAKENRKKIISHFTNKIFATKILLKGDTKISILLKDNEKQVDLRIINNDEWGSALQYFTGSKEHNIHLRKIAKEKGYKISEYGIFNTLTNEKIAGRTEDDIYTVLGYQFIPPEMRENKGELELAKNNKIPQLITMNDIKGDLQMHSLWSDGMHSIEEIAKFLKKNFKYEYIAITDHSKSSRIANGINEKDILKQIEAIDLVNNILEEDFVKYGIEVDIDSKGSLDISDEILAQLNWVTASIHSGFNQDNTDRIIRACENPFVFCIGHPTGRLIGSRDPYQIDVKKIILAAKQTNTALEINAQPNRMDLNDELAAVAREEGVKLVINSDSHTLQNFHYMELGVSIARRAWCTKENIINTMKWDEIEKWINQKRKLKL